MLNRLRRWWRLRYGDIMTQIREDFAAMGYDLSDYTDQEIAHSIVTFSGKAQRMGITLNEANARLTRDVLAAYPEEEEKQ